MINHEGREGHEETTNKFKTNTATNRVQVFALDVIEFLRDLRALRGETLF
jgi:hypothetical protein